METDQIQKPPKKKRLTKKQKGFVKDYIKTGNATEAAIKNYDTDNRKVAQNIGSDNLSKPIIVKTLVEMLPDDLLSEKHLELLNKRDVVKVFNPASGEFDMTLIDQPETQAVSKALDMAYKLKGSYAPDKHENLTNILQINIDAKTLEIAKKFEEELNKLEDGK